MGRLYRFDCPRCGFTARAGAGTIQNSGFSTATIVCKDCKEIYDVVSALRLAPSMVNSARKSFGRQRIVLSAERLLQIEDKVNLPPSMLPHSRKLILQQLNPTPLARFLAQRWFQVKLLCPVNPRHRIQPWKTPARCPNCEDYLDTTLLPYRVWD